MRNYIYFVTQRVNLYDPTGSADPTWLESAAGDLETLEELVVLNVSYFLQQGQPQTEVVREDVKVWYLEMNKDNVMLLMAIVWPLINGTSSPPATGDYEVGNYFAMLSDESPRDTWSHGH